MLVCWIMAAGVPGSGRSSWHAPLMGKYSPWNMFPPWSSCAWLTMWVSLPLEQWDCGMWRKRGKTTRIASSPDQDKGARRYPQLVPTAEMGSGCVPHARMDPFKSGTIARITWVSKCLIAIVRAPCGPWIFICCGISVARWVTMQLARIDMSLFASIMSLLGQVNVAMKNMTAHMNGSDTSCLCFSYDNQTLASRGGESFFNVVTVAWCILEFLCICWINLIPWTGCWLLTEFLFSSILNALYMYSSRSLLLGSSKSFWSHGLYKNCTLWNFKVAVFSPCITQTLLFIEAIILCADFKEMRVECICQWFFLGINLLFMVLSPQVMTLWNYGIYAVSRNLSVWQRTSATYILCEFHLRYAMTAVGNYALILVLIFLYSTDCIFSPDDRLVLTGISAHKNQPDGKLIFFDRQTLQRVSELNVVKEEVNSILHFCIL